MVEEGDGYGVLGMENVGDGEAYVVTWMDDEVKESW